MKYLLVFLFILFQTVVVAQSATSKIDSIIQKAYQEKAFNGSILIAKEGKIVFEKNLGFADFEKKKLLNKNSQFQIASVSKQFTAFGIMVLKQQGKLAYDELVMKYIPDFPYSKITIRQLMQHTSGLPDFWNDIRPNLDTLRSNGNADVLAYLSSKKLPLRFESGEKWEYSDIGYDILANIIEKISNQPYNVFLKKYIFKPAGMKNTEGLLVTDIRRIKSKNLARGYIEDSLKGNELAHEVRNFVFYLGDFYGDGSVISTVRDMKKWDDAWQQFMQKDSLHYAEAFKPMIKKDGSVLEIPKGVSYGFGWSLRQDVALGKMYSHNGGHPGFTTNFYRFPDKKMMLIVCRNVTSRASFFEYLQEIRGILKEI